MRVNRLYLQQYRNIESLDFTFKHNLTVFVGNNGQGKTNIIESLVFLSSGRSFRVLDDTLLIKQGHEFASIDALIDESYRLRVVLSEKAKYLQVNKQVIRKLSEFLGHCNVVLFSPDDLNFFTEAPRKRRRDIDYEMGKLSKRYLELISSYSKVLSERNAYLKKAMPDPIYHEIVTQSLIELQIPIMKQREAFSLAISPLMTQWYQRFNGSDDIVTIEYKGPVSVDEDCVETLTRRYQEFQQREIDMRVTQLGVHRDDYTMKLNGEPVINIASQGQKRMIMVAYTFALVSLIYEKQSQYPILCLDDLFSELDETRRKRVLEMIPPTMQTFITTTDLRFIQTSNPMNLYHIDQGRILKEDQ